MATDIRESILAIIKHIIFFLVILSCIQLTVSIPIGGAGNNEVFPGGVSINGTVSANAFVGSGAGLINLPMSPVGYLFAVYGALEVTNNIAQKFYVSETANVTQIVAYTKSTAGTFQLNVVKGSDYNFTVATTLATLTFAGANSMVSTSIASPSLVLGNYLRIDVVSYTTGADLTVIVKVAK